MEDIRSEIDARLAATETAGVALGLQKLVSDLGLGAKFAHYQRLPSLDSYLLVSQKTRRIEHFQRLPTGQWLLTVAEEGAITIPCLEGDLQVDDVYWQVELGPA